MKKATTNPLPNHTGLLMQAVFRCKTIASTQKQREGKMVNIERNSLELKVLSNAIIDNNPALFDYLTERNFKGSVFNTIKHADIFNTLKTNGLDFEMLYQHFCSKMLNKDKAKNLFLEVLNADVVYLSNDAHLSSSAKHGFIHFPSSGVGPHNMLLLLEMDFKAALTDAIRNLAIATEDPVFKAACTELLPQIDLGSEDVFKIIEDVQDYFLSIVFIEGAETIAGLNSDVAARAKRLKNKGTLQTLLAQIENMSQTNGANLTAVRHLTDLIKTLNYSVPNPDMVLHHVMSQTA
jgi:hypothetical protein